MIGARQSTNTLAWEPLFSLILGNPEEKFPFAIDADTSATSLMIDVPVNKDSEFKQMMTGLYVNGLPASVRVRQSAASEERKESKRAASQALQSITRLPTPDENKLADGLSVYKNLFGKRQKISGATYMDVDDLFDPNQGAQARNGVLMSIPLDPDAAIKPYKIIVANLANSFRAVTAERIRQACSSTDQQLPEAKSVNPSDPVSFEVRLFGQCLEVVTGPNAENHLESRIYFNFKLLWKLISPPEFVQAVGGDQKEEMIRYIFDKEHLLSYLQTLAKSPVILSQAKGVFIASQRQLAHKPNVVYFICDISGSMGEKAKNEIETPIDILKKRLEEFLFKLKDSPAAERTQVRFVFYATTTGNTHVFAMHQIDDMLKLIRSQQANGSTRSAGTIADVFRAIQREGLILSHNVFIVNVGDGLDNDGGIPEEYSKQSIALHRAKIETSTKKFIELESKHANVVRPYFITLACGLQRDESFHQQLATATAGKCLNEIDLATALIGLIDNVKLLQWTRQVLTVVERLEQESKDESHPVPNEVVRTVSVYLNGEPQVFTIDNPFGERTSLYINGDRFSTTPGPRTLSLPVPSNSPLVPAIASPETEQQESVTTSPLVSAVVSPKTEQKESITASRFSASAKALADRASSALTTIRTLAHDAYHTFIADDYVDEEEKKPSKCNIM